MRKIRPWLPASFALALAVLAGGCFMTSAQIFVHYALPDPILIDSSADTFAKVDVDLNAVGDYADHKDKLEGLADAAVLGRFTNVSGPAGAVEIWITPGATSLGSVDEVRANAVRLWSGSIGPTGSVRNLTWAESAKSFTAAGKKILVDEVKGDGRFTLYTFGTSGTYQIRVDKGVVVLVLDAGV